MQYNFFFHTLLFLFYITFFLFPQPGTAKDKLQDKLKPYGFIHFDFIGATRAVQSSRYTNLSAPTAASPSDTKNVNQSRDSFQVAQSRFGTLIILEKTTGQFEIDFVDFNKASPTTQSNPRLRIAKIDYQIDFKQKITIGQTIDLFASSYRPFSYIMVGSYYKAGNVGFIRPQIRYTYQASADWKLAAALGLIRFNPENSDGIAEMSLSPAVSFLVSHRFTNSLEGGLTTLTGTLRNSLESQARSSAYGINTFFRLEMDSGIKWTESIYFGKNLGSTGALSLAYLDPNGTSHHEFGGYLSAFFPLSEKFSLQGGLGVAKILEPEGSFDGKDNSSILSNLKLEGAFTYAAEKYLSFYIQPIYFQTHYIKNQQSDLSNSIVLQLGCLFRF